MALFEDLALVIIGGGIVLVAFVFIVLCLIGAVFMVGEKIQAMRKRRRRARRQSPGPRHIK